MCINWPPPAPRSAATHFFCEAVRSSHEAKAVATGRQHEQAYGRVPGQRRHLPANSVTPDGEAARSITPGTAGDGA